MSRLSFSLHRGLLAAIAVALLAGIIPAGVVLDRQLARELEARARKDLAMAPAIVRDRTASEADALMMRAKDLAQMPGLGAALARADNAAARLILLAQSLPPGTVPVAVTGTGAEIIGFRPDSAVTAATRRGEIPVTVQAGEDRLVRLALAPVEHDGVWRGAAGLAVALDETAAGVLAGLLRAEVLLLDQDGRVRASTMPDSALAWLRDDARALPADSVRVVQANGDRHLVVRATLGPGASAVFARNLERDLALVPVFRRVLIVSGLAALGVAMLLGAVLAGLLARPAHALATASDAVARGDFAVPLPPSPVRELDRVATAFAAMRRTLAARLEELEQANRDLAEREQRLTALQAELMQRDRLAASQRLVAELAHEIRNPVANIRNLLEVLHRRTSADGETREFIDMAIDELLRMHELAEYMLDLNRPRDLGAARCDLASVADEVAGMTHAGAGKDRLRVDVTGSAHAAIPPDAMKQILFNLVQNARDVMPDGLTLTIAITGDSGVAAVEVADNGPGIPADVLPRVFDPFFTTKDTVHGTGLGLFVAEGLVRRYGGRMTAHNRDDGGGARFRIEIPAAAAVTAPAEDA